MPDQHVTRHKNGGWQVKGAGDSKVTSKHDTQKQAIDAAKVIAENQGKEVIIHRKNGQIRTKDSYGNDPYPPKG